MMKIFKVSAWSIGMCALLLSACAQTPSNPQSPETAQSEAKELPIPPEFKESTEKEFALGGVIKIYDDVAWIGTDAITAAGYKGPQPGVKAGFVVEPMDNDLNGLYQLSFINEIDGQPKVVAFAQVKHDSGMGHVLGAKVADTPIEPSYEAKQLYQSLASAKAAPDLKLCPTTYNSVVLPYVEAGKTEYRVYFLMSTTTKGNIPVGGHVLVRVAADTKTVLEVEPLSKSCNVQPGGDDPRAVALEFSNLALDSPSAAQVFLMLRYEKPVYVMTKNRFLWGIDSQGIRLLSDDVSKK